MKEVTVYKNQLSHGWYWYIKDNSGPPPPVFGPFKIEALAAKDAYYQMGGPIIDAMKAVDISPD